jgi:hypothetical protein
VPTIPTAFDNTSFKGISFNYEIVRGAPSSLFLPEMTERERRLYFRSNYRAGDTVYLKYALLDEDSYRFWFSANSEIVFGQNPFMSPAPIHSNIKCQTNPKEKCLGVWCGSAKKEVWMVLDTTTSKTTCTSFSIR